MSQYHESAGDAAHQKMCADRLRLITLYLRMNELYGSLHHASASFLRPRERACALVLEEDFRCLIKECQAYLLHGLPHGERSLESLISRSLTVLEESCELLKVGKVVPILAAKAKKFEHHPH